MNGTGLCVNKPHLVPVIFEPPCINVSWMKNLNSPFFNHSYLSLIKQAYFF